MPPHSLQVTLPGASCGSPCSIDAALEGGDLCEALNRSADAAEEGMKGTIPLEARKGRASYLGPRSIGHQDPGATSSYLPLRAAAETPP